MKFWEAMKALEDGYKIRKSLWPASEFLVKKGSVMVCDEGAPYFLESAGPLWNGDWELYQEQKKEYPFDQIKHSSGVFFRRKAWPPGAVLHTPFKSYSVPPMNGICIHGSFPLSLEDLMATDWVEDRGTTV